MDLSDRPDTEFGVFLLYVPLTISADISGISH